MNFNEINTGVSFTNPRQVEYELPAVELAQQDAEAEYLYNEIREIPEAVPPRASGYERGARITLQALENVENWSFSRLLRRAIIALICCLWSISASLGRLTDIAIKKKELLLFFE